MHLFPFVRVFPERGSSECRVIHTAKHPGLPDGAYALMESYCIDPDCDCRRVMLNIFNSEISSEFLASISYGFDQEEEYAGPFMDPLNPQSEYAGALFPLPWLGLCYQMLPMWPGCSPITGRSSVPWQTQRIESTA